VWEHVGGGERRDAQHIGAAMLGIAALTPTYALTAHGYAGKQ
jgi:hypothetical protein